MAFASGVRLGALMWTPPIDRSVGPSRQEERHASGALDSVPVCLGARDGGSPYPWAYPAVAFVRVEANIEFREGYFVLPPRLA